MTATANIPLHQVRGEQSEFPLLAAAKVFEGAMLGLSAGYARPLVAGDPFVGHATEYQDNTSGANGDLTVARYRGRYRLQVTITGVAITDVGAQVYASADDTLTLTAGANSRVGVVDRYVTTNTAIVEFQTQEVATMLSDLTALLSNMATVSGASDFTVLQSDLTSVKSDGVVLKSDMTAEKSDAVVFKSDIAAGKSNTTTNASHITVTRSDLTAARSDTTVNLSNVRTAVSNAKVAAAAGDYVNVSDIKVTVAEILTALSDALG